MTRPSFRRPVAALTAALVAFAIWMPTLAAPSAHAAAPATCVLPAELA